MRSNHKTRAALAALSLFLAAAPAAVGAEAVPDERRPPNILLILADDLGFSDLGCYGSDIATPNLDRLAAGGLRFTQFYNTGRCWPTRSALLTGYYPQQVGMDPIRWKKRLPSWGQTLAKRLKPAGYRSYQSGKWHLHNTPNPKTGGGFDHCYVVEGGQNNFFKASDVKEDGKRLADRPGFYMTTGIADHAIRCLQDHAANHAEQPFFEYLAFIAPHFPLHALPEDIERYRDRYLRGWDQVREERWKNLRRMGIVDCGLAPLEPDHAPRYFKPGVLKTLGLGEVARAVPWTQLTTKQKRFQATKMAIHAAMIDRMDREIGRVFDQVKAMDAWENTIILFLSDNGTDATIMVRGGGHDPKAPAGSERSYLCLGPGWSSAGNAPFRRHKVWTHEGGISTPLIAHWPAGIKARGELHHTPGHVVDLVPTLLELAGVDATQPENAPPFPGTSLTPLLKTDHDLKRDFIYFEHEGNRGLRIGDYKLVSAREDHNVWELYDLGKDRCEQDNLAGSQPERVQAMAARWKKLHEQFHQKQP